MIKKGCHLAAFFILLNFGVPEKGTRCKSVTVAQLLVRHVLQMPLPKARRRRNQE